MRSKVPPQVCSTSSGWAAMARTSRFMEISRLPVQILPAGISLLWAHQIHEQNAGDKSADVGEKCRPSLRHLGAGEALETAEELDGEPVDQHYPGGYVEGGDEEQDECQRADPRVGELDHICSHHSGDRAARTHHGYPRKGI